MKNTIVLVALVLGLSAVPVLADSIWDRRDYGSAFLFVDTRARRVGDLVTIQISEMTGIDNKDQRDAIKNTKTGGTFSFKGSIKGNNASRSAEAALDTLTTSQRELRGQSQYKVDQALTDKITATVVFVYPNGNMVVEGTRTRVIGAETRTLMVSGIIRPIDISPTNTIQSQFVGEFRITYLGQGDQSAYTNNGWLGRIFNLVWPW